MINITEIFTPVNSIEILSKGTLIKQGDTKTQFQIQLLDASSQPINLTGASAKIFIANQSNNVLLLQKNATLTSTPTEGKVIFHFDDNDATGNGIINIQVNITYSDGTIEKFPANGYKQISITPSLDNLQNVQLSTYTINQVVDSLTGGFTSSLNSLQTTLQSNINNKVDKITGKNLSTNDFTNDYKTKLDSISSAMDIDGGVWS